MTRKTPSPDELRATVREKYASVARGDGLSCCGADGCGSEIDMIGEAYEGTDGYVADADLKLGCGVPVEHAGLAPGQTVLDLGAGAGLDAFVARRIVGDEGEILGVDFTPEMVEKARRNARALGYGNVRFEHGDIESLPFADASVDVVISNCVLNLVPDKGQAFREMRRVLRPGGWFCISDVVHDGDLPEAVRASAELHAGCVAGAMALEEYVGLLNASGFEDVEVVTSTPITLPDGLGADVAEAVLRSVTVRGFASEAGEAGLSIYEPAMCCSSGVCGPEPDDTLIRFSADVDALATEGIRVERFNLSQQPDAFVSKPAVRDALHRDGVEALPLVLRGREVVSRGRYPSRDELRGLLA